MRCVVQKGTEKRKKKETTLIKTPCPELSTKVSFTCEGLPYVARGSDIKFTFSKAEVLGRKTYV